MNELTVVTTGDSMISKRISVFTEEEFLSAIRLIQGADVAFTNCEIIFHNYASFPMATIGFATVMGAEPSMAEDLKWAGFTLVSLSNSHIMDFGPYGMFSTMETFEKLKITYAGVGRDLDEAREPKYLETEKGRIALISSGADTFQEGWEKASNARGGVMARPGRNMLRLDTHYVVDATSFENLKGLKAKLKMPEDERAKLLEADELIFADRKFKQGDKVGVYILPRKKDIEGDLLSVKDAKRSADWVFVSFHSHSESEKGLEYPNDFICQYARACIDAGADAFLGHGPHILRGIEIYKGKPIFYSLGNFIPQNSTVARVTADQYDFFGLDEKARPSDFYEARHGMIPPTKPPYDKWWLESAIAEFSFKQERLSAIKLYPITLGYGEPRASYGRPKIAQNEQARTIIEHLRDISASWGTEIEYEEGVGIVKLPF